MPITKDSLFEQLHIDDLGVDQVLERVKDIIHEGNVRRLIVKDAQGTTLLEDTAPALRPQPLDAGEPVGHGLAAGTA